MKVLRKRTFTCNGEGEYPGYECEEGGRLFPAFTYRQMLECQLVQAGLVEKYGNESYALLECHGTRWAEVYEDGEIMIPFRWTEFEGEFFALFVLGPDWPWDM
jgi:hypothetical protein